MLVVQPGQPAARRLRRRLPGLFLAKWRLSALRDHERALSRRVPERRLHRHGLPSAGLNGNATMDIAQVAPSPGGAHLQLVRREGEVPDKLVRVKVAGLGERVQVLHHSCQPRHPRARHRAPCRRLPGSRRQPRSESQLRERDERGSPGASSSTPPAWPGRRHRRLARLRRARGADIEASRRRVGHDLLRQHHQEAWSRPRPARTVSTRSPTYPRRRHASSRRTSRAGLTATYERTSTAAFSSLAGGALGTYLVQRDGQADSDERELRRRAAHNASPRDVTFRGVRRLWQSGQGHDRRLGIRPHIAELEYRNDQFRLAAWACRPRGPIHPVQ